MGLATAVGLATHEHAVELVETRPDRLAALREGRPPIYEPGLEEGFRAATEQGLVGVTDAPSGPTDVVLVCVGTPFDPASGGDLSQVAGAVASVLRAGGDGVPIVIRSTLPPGGSERLARDLGLDREHLLTNPEFLREGSALDDFNHPSRIVVGRFAETRGAHVELVAGLYDGIDAPVLVVDVGVAELVKNAAGAFLALRLAFVNELASLCEAHGTDAAAVLRTLGMDPRIGSAYLEPALGFGGSCLPKDVRVMAGAARAAGLEAPLLASIEAANRAQVERFAERVLVEVGDPREARVALLGLAFKAGTDDVRESPALELARRLLRAGAHVVGYDPRAAEGARRELPDLDTAPSARQALADADVAVIATEWPEFRALDWAAARTSMRRPAVVDGRRLLDAETMLALGYRYVAVGAPEAQTAGGRGVEPIPVPDPSGTAALAAAD